MHSSGVHSVGERSCVNLSRSCLRRCLSADCPVLLRPRHAGMRRANSSNAPLRLQPRENAARMPRANSPSAELRAPSQFKDLARFLMAAEEIPQGQFIRSLYWSDMSVLPGDTPKYSLPSIAPHSPQADWDPANHCIARPRPINVECRIWILQCCLPCASSEQMVRQSG